MLDASVFGGGGGGGRERVQVAKRDSFGEGNDLAALQAVDELVEVRGVLEERVRGILKRMTVGC